MKDVKEIKTCAICGKPLPYPRPHTDTCGTRCFKKQLAEQRAREGGRGMIELRFKADGKLYPCWCQGCCMRMHPAMLTGYCITDSRCNRCGYVGDLAIIKAGAA